MGRLRLEIDNIDRTDLVLWEDSQFQEAASEGDNGVGTLVLRDADGTGEWHFGQDVALYDDNQLAWKGIFGAKVRGREEEVDHYSTRRSHIMTLLDSNWLFDWKRVEGWVRTEETDIVRVKAVIDEYRPTVDRNTYVPSGGSKTMEARTYKDAMVRDVVSDCAEISGKNFWIDRYRNLHYAVPGALASNVAAWTLTDTLADYAHSITVGLPSAYNIGLIVRSDDPNSIPFQNDVLLKYGKSSSVNVEDAASIAAYGRFQGPPITDERAKNVTSATNRANAFLEKAKEPEISYTTTIGVGRLDQLIAGVWVACTSEHQNLSATKLQIARWTATRKGNAYSGYWSVDLELANPKRFRPRGAGFVDNAGPPDEVWVCDPTTVLVPWCSDDDITDPLYVEIVDEDDYNISDEAVKLYDGATYHIHWAIDHDSTAVSLVQSVPAAHMQAVASSAQFGHKGLGHEDLAGDFQPGPEPLYEWEFDKTMPVSGIGSGDLCWNVWLYRGAGYAGSNSVGTNLICTVTYLYGPDPRFEGQGLCTNDPPESGQDAEQTIAGDGFTTSWTLYSGYKAGTLRTFVDNTDQSPAIVEDDPEAGTFSLPFAPKVGEFIYAYYKAF